MSRVIYKYTLQGLTKSVIILPVKARILSVKEQAPNTLTMWVLVDPYATGTRDYEILVIPTGLKLELDLVHHTFLDTVILSNGEVYHVFYRSL